MQELQQYFAELERKVKVAYSIANQAREKGLDPVSRVEIPLAASLVERVTGLVSVKYPQIKDARIEKRILELEKEHGLSDPAVALTIAEEIAKEKFCKFKSQLEAIDAGIRVGLAYLTLGVVASPLEGFTHFTLKKTKNKQDYFTLFYSGPIRSAGGTAAALSVVIADYLRETLGYAKYDASEAEVRRAVTELYDFHERITNLQYLPSEQEIEAIARGLPVQIAGEPSEDKEVSNYKDLPRVETNFLRSGFCLVMAEGIAQKTPKLWKKIAALRKKGFKLSDWDFLKGVIKLQEKETSEESEERPKPSFVFIKDLVAGRPVLTHPSRAGGFRLRYGRTRCSGYSCAAIHPATQLILNSFIAIGTQLKTERPGKSAAITICDSIEGPIVKLKDSSLVKINRIEDAIKLKDKVAEIIYVGDILISYGDFYNRNHSLMPCGYNEEYWFAMLKEKLKKKEDENAINPREVNLEQAIQLSRKFGIPLHPKYTFFWSQIKKDEFAALIDWLCKAKINKNIVLPYNSDFDKAKRALELLGVEHSCEKNIVIKEETSKVLLLNLGIKGKEEAAKKLEKIKEKITGKSEEDILSFVNKLCPFKIKDKAGTFIGARMGRPEKAKLRKLTGSPHVLFPVGDEGGRFRSVQETLGKKVTREFPAYYCEKCKADTIYPTCEVCREKTKKLFYCPACSQFVDEESHKRFANEEERRKHRLQTFTKRGVNIQHYLDCAAKNLNFGKEEMPELIKGVRGTSSAEHVPENLAKGILRAQFGLHVNKDGTIRYDATELPITQFKPKEIRTSIEILKKFGYTHDICDRPLTNDNQIIELKPQDVILPSCPETLDEKADDVFVKITKFIDHLLVRFYALQPFYNVSSAEDLIGHLIVCIAPHTSAGVVGRIIGFSKAQALFASPYFHAAMRRDADGDEAAIMLLLDTLLNFSREYLPAHRGGTQDAPIILNTRIKAGEVDDMVFDIETVEHLPLELYEAAERYASPSSVKIEQIRDRIKSGHVFKDLHCTQEIDNINSGITCSAYKILATMREKVAKQMEIVEKLRAVDESDVARLIIERHFIRDIRGNLRKFSMQQFRCVKCNTKYRRLPLTGKCLKIIEGKECGGRIIFTIAEGSIKKYLEPALQLAKRYNVSPYLKQSLELTKKRIESIFGSDPDKQQELQKWM